jgi:D-arginine dehydrogenase
VGETQFDIIVIGAGMAGASVAAELATQAKVLLREMESAPGYHTTGRSAAVFAETYGPPPIRALTRASAAFFEAPPAGFAQHPLLSGRDIMMIARADQFDALDRLIDEVSGAATVERLDALQTRARSPLLRDGYAMASMLDSNGRDIDVNGLHQGYLRAFRAAGGTIATDVQVSGLEHSGDIWHVSGGTGGFTAPVVVNAAGAWADQIGGKAGAVPIGLVPKRRTAITVAAPDGANPDVWPITIDVEEQFYVKPDAGKLLMSPADETPSPPCDAQPEEIDIAICVDRVETAFDLSVRHIESRWAGLRSFVADKAPVCGYDPGAPGFFWLAGQGGYGIQSAPGLSRTAAALVLQRPVPQDVLDQGLDPADISPRRPGLAV